MKNNIIKFPISESQIFRNLRGEFAVPCEVSERWLAFDPTSSQLQSGEFLSLSVMTLATNGSKKKLCDLFITRENLLEVISKIKPKE